MKRRYSKFFPIIFLILDLISLNAGIILANFIRFDKPLYFDDSYLILHVFLNASWLAIFYVTKLHETARESKLLDIINKVLLALVINLSLTFALWVGMKAYYFSREHLFYTFLFFSILITAWRIAFYYFIRYYRTKGYNIRNVAVVGLGPTAKNLVKYIKNTPELGYVFHGYFDNHTEGQDVLGDVDALEEYCENENVDLIFCCLPKLYDEEIKRVVDFAENNLIKIKVISRFSNITNKNLSIQKYGEIPVINVSSIPLDSPYNRFVKRAFDLVFSSLVMIFLLSWIVPLIGLLIKFESKGPIFFKQYRNGKGNEKFLCWKFRTMRVNEQADTKQATKNDPRITKIGAILRKTSLDELPQFINVFLGDMSVVGPRPHPIKLNEEFLPKIDRFIQRHAVKPGITGLAQAKGYRGETSHFSAMYGRVKLDRFYVKNWSLILDLKIIILTVLSIVKGQETAY
ncbi:MAG: undecaprenyl-phosphate glucose phosphotransferase [Cyclobacteriaceae bacterium]